ncbi:MAG: transcription antitermination factor NusB [Acidimicrobiia bacterium]
MSSRREARERALGLCYELEVRAVDVDTFLAELPMPPDPYAEALVRGVAEHESEIDELLTKYSEHWAVDRMPAIDRAVLRIGCFELGWMPELSSAVVLNEAVDLAKEYSTKDSGRFVNGLLARVSDHVRGADSSEAVS